MKKIIIFPVLVIYLFCVLASPIVFAEEIPEKTQAVGIFTPEISFEYTKNLTDEPIAALQKQEVDIKVKFKLDMGSIAKWLFFKRRIGRVLLFGPGYLLKIKGLPESNLTISISECPTWCTANIDTDVFEFSFDDISKNADSSVEKTVKLEFTVNENATALLTDAIEIQAEFMGISAINAITKSTTINVKVAYEPDILFEAVSELLIPPLKNTTLPINITNNGNGDSIISIQFINPENWTATFDQEVFTLKVNETIQITFTINPPKEFNNQTINFSFIPKSTVGEYQGAPVNSSIIFINDGSLEEEGGHDVLVVGIIILIIIIIMVVTYLFLIRKKQ